MEQSSDSPPAATVNVGPTATHKAASPSGYERVGAEREARLPATAELFALAREIAVLRAALRKIANCPNPDSVENCHDQMWVIAQEALGD